MPRRLIVNADDFGLTPGINRAIAELHDAGALTSATLMASGPAFRDAVSVARSRPLLGVGCHLVFTDGLPLSPARAVPSLLASDRRSLRPRLTHFLAALLTGQIDGDELEREAVAQIQHLQHAGLRVTHVDTHKHTHLFPQVLGPVLRAMQRTGVPSLRNPFEQPWAFPLSNGTTARTSQLRLLAPLKRSFLRQPLIQSGAVHTTDGTVGISATGSLDRTTLRNLLQALPEGTWELVCHPGYNDRDLDQITTRLRQSREIECDALLTSLGNSSLPNSPLDTQQEQHPRPTLPELIHYGDLTNSLQTDHVQRTP